MNGDVGSGMGPSRGGALTKDYLNRGRPRSLPDAIFDNLTPYQIFRNFSTVAGRLPGDEARRDLVDEGSNAAKSEDGEEDENGEEENEKEKEDDREGGGGGNDKENVISTGNAGYHDSSIGPVGVLSPDSIAIRENARRILMKQPRNKKRRKLSAKRPPLLPINTANEGNAGNAHQPFRDIKELEAGIDAMKRETKEMSRVTARSVAELEANVGAMKAAVRDAASRVARLEAGVEATNA